MKIVERIEPTCVDSVQAPETTLAPPSALDSAMKAHMHYGTFEDAMPLGGAWKTNSRPLDIMYADFPPCFTQNAGVCFHDGYINPLRRMFVKFATPICGSGIWLLSERNFITTYWEAVRRLNLVSTTRNKIQPGREILVWLGTLTLVCSCVFCPNSVLMFDWFISNATWTVIRT